VTAHADVTSYESEQKQDRNLLPPSRGGRDVNIGTPAVRTILKADSSHLFFPPGQFQTGKSLDAFRFAQGFLGGQVPSGRSLGTTFGNTENGQVCQSQQGRRNAVLGVPGPIL
jgi:hypothetical protein